MKKMEKNERQLGNDDKVAVTGSMVVEADNMIVNTPQITIPGGVMKDKMVPVLVVLVIVGAFAVGLLYGKVSVYEKGVVAGAKTQESDTQGTGNNQVQAPQVPEVVNLTEDQINQIKNKAIATKGDKNAKVTMIEFTDFQCPFCSRYYTDSYGKIIKDYVDTGKVFYVTMDLPLPFHPNAKPAALAARCAGAQDKYWEMHDVLFEKQSDWSEGDATETFKQYAKEIGLNTNKFNTCFDDGEFNAAIDEGATLASSVGASGTPTFYINGTQLVGAVPFTEFQKALDEALQ